MDSFTSLLPLPSTLKAWSQTDLTIRTAINPIRPIKAKNHNRVRPQSRTSFKTRAMHDTATIYQKIHDRRAMTDYTTYCIWPRYLEPEPPCFPKMRSNIHPGKGVVKVGVLLRLGIRSIRTRVGVLSCLNIRQPGICARCRAPEKEKRG